MNFSFQSSDLSILWNWHRHLTDNERITSHSTAEWQLRKNSSILKNYVKLTLLSLNIFHVSTAQYGKTRILLSHTWKYLVKTIYSGIWYLILESWFHEIFWYKKPAMNQIRMKRALKNTYFSQSLYLYVRVHSSFGLPLVY